MARFRLLSIDPSTAAIVEHDLPIDKPGSTHRVRLRAVDGASAIHVPIRDESQIRLRAEVKANGGEEVAVVIEHDAAGDLHPTSQNAVELLPAARRTEPKPIEVRKDEQRLDLAIVVDGTTRFYQVVEAQEKREERLDLLLAHQERWQEHVQKLGQLVERLVARYPIFRFTVLAFGDMGIDGVEAADLQPFYRIWPPRNERSFHRWERSRFVSSLKAFRPTSGADFVDALGDAIRACRFLPWDDEARKLVCITGDSPGHSLLFPPPVPEADGNARRWDVDVEALELFHSCGVEVATLYHDVAEESGYQVGDVASKLIEFAEKQYRRLASRAEMAFLSSSFDPANAAERIIQSPVLLGRGPCLGIRVDSENPQRKTVGI